MCILYELLTTKSLRSHSFRIDDNWHTFNFCSHFGFTLIVLTSDLIKKTFFIDILSPYVTAYGFVGNLSMSPRKSSDEQVTKEKKGQQQHSYRELWRINNCHSSSIFKVEFPFLMACYFIHGYKISNTLHHPKSSVSLFFLLYRIDIYLVLLFRL